MSSLWPAAAQLMIHGAMVIVLLEIMLDLKRRGLPMLLVEQSLSVCRAVADRHAILDEGRIVWTGDGAAPDAADAVLERHLTLEKSGT